MHVARVAGEKPFPSSAGRPGPAGLKVPAACAIGFGVIMALLTEDWSPVLSAPLLWAAWCFLPREEGPAVLPLAFSFQWLQVTIGVYYHGLTGRRVWEMDIIDHQPAILIGLACLGALLVGLLSGLRLVHAPGAPSRPSRAPVSSKTVGALYVGSVAVTGIVREFAWKVPEFTEAILGLTLVRFGFLLLLFRRLVHPAPRWLVVFLLAGAEIVLGFTGYFAGFREALALAGLAVLERFDGRWRSWATLGGLGCAVVITAVVWTGIKGDYRRDFDDGMGQQSRVTRIQHIAALAKDWFALGPGEFMKDADLTVSRIWAVHYPALAFARVPSVIPHQDGDILSRALLHIVTPRFAFPDKAELASDSEMVRRYAGVRVAGAEQGTSIAFGYVAESYIDFGMPVMLLPIFVFGIVMGVAYRAVFRLYHHREIAIAVGTVIFWISLYLFERSWIKMLGSTFSLLVYLGGATILLDRLMANARHARCGAAASN